MDAFTALSIARLVLDIATEARAAAKQTGEWTDEQEAQFKSEWADMRLADHWQIDPD